MDAKKSQLEVTQLLVDPHHPDTLYRVKIAFGSFQLLVSVSRDGGATFTRGAPFTDVNSGFRPVIASPAHDELLAFIHEGLRVSTDGGQSWHLRGLFRGDGFLRGVLAPSAPDTLYGIPNSRNQCLARSDDDGAHWRSLPYPPRLPSGRAGCYDAAVDPEDALRSRSDGPGTLLAGTDLGLFSSADGGLHWSPLGDLPAGAGVRQLARDPLSSSWYAATADRGIFRSLDNGAHWELLAGAPDHDNPTIAVDPRRPTALLAAFAEQGLWRWTP